MGKKYSKTIRFMTQQAVLNFYDKAVKSDGDIDVIIDKKIMDGKSLLGLMSLDLSREMLVVLDTDDENSASELIRHLDDLS